MDYSLLGQLIKITNWKAFWSLASDLDLGLSFVRLQPWPWAGHLNTSKDSHLGDGIAFASSGPHCSACSLFANILNEDRKCCGKYHGLACCISVPTSSCMQILGSQKLHFLDVLTAWVLDMNYIPSIRCILERFGGWKWSRNYPSHLWWLFLQTSS